MKKGMRSSVEAEVIEAGKCVINAQKFLQTMRVMEGETVLLTVNEETLEAVYQLFKERYQDVLTFED